LKRALKLVVLCLAAALPGCERAAAERGGAQLAAKVNGAEISVRQLRSAGAPSASQALEKVIERELLVQQALKAGLERDPAVKETIDISRRQILAQAWLDRVAAGKAVSREEVRAFYAEHPELFAERRVYRVRETRLLPAERVPLAHLSRLARMGAGETAVLDTASGDPMEVQVVQAEEAPLSETQATALIEQFLAGRKRLELAAAEVRRLREVATIEYAGEFKRSN
jgi:predicted transcriptional regulator